MDYGKLLTRAWHIIWTHKFLILLGVLAALGSGSGSGSFGSGGTSNFGSESAGNGFQFKGMPPDLGQIEGIGGLGLAVIVVMAGLILLVGLVVWIVSRIATGGLIAGVATIDGGGLSSFGRDWQAGWAKGWRLIGIGLIPLIPVLILLVVSIGVGGLMYGLSGTVSPESVMMPPTNSWVVALVIATACVTVPVAIVLNLLRALADRACMLEDAAVWAAYRRGGRVLLDNLGPAIILFLIQIAIGMGLGIALLIRGLIMVLCCLLWPLLLLVQGAIAAYFSTLWTLAWREWTGVTV